ncbi:pilus assembly protein [Alteriqipengyuania flavescens]|uniref:TadE/TadG family type IV pilus assembly protein n=1 Tax=Alteriqipengyuania flavescens TaxID=3053610 RepID=UPI0025B59A8D|nr:pilus assembly protein [Alteriqipengyuania flavescens]WJY18182.1 pilus assembly protein [Alteriqipengyuania flavescens]WJY24123.1 pilus assembly protein [Alteriqipengyuania flavescens]
MTLSLRQMLRALRDDTSGIALTEMALVTPFLLGFSLFAIESTFLTIMHMRINQVAIHIADNASRIGDVSTLEDRKIYEADINDLLLGAHLQAGADVDLYEHGRVILSSLETKPDTGKQWLHWQRCKGKKVHASSYGKEGDTGGSFQGMGPKGNKVVAQPDDAVMFVEVVYEYQPLFSDMFVQNAEISAYSAFTVRADRDLTQIYQQDPSSPDALQVCSKYDAFAAT